MPVQRDAVLRRQQAHWMRPDAARWVRPDCARFLIAGTDPADVYPALALKYSRDQPRVPAGNSDGGQWTSGSSGRPRVIIDTTNWGNDPSAGSDDGIDLGGVGLGSIDFGNIGAGIDWLNLFRIGPDADKPGRIHLAGDRPRGIGGPNDGPPEIPKRMPTTVDERMKFVRDAVRWIGKVGRYSPLADAFLGAAEEIGEISRLTDAIRTGNDPPRSLEELRDRANEESERGYQDHHIVGQHVQNRQQFGDAAIDSSVNRVRIPTVKHLDLNAWYSRPNADYGNLSPRDYLRGKSWEEQMSVGIQRLRDMGIVKP